MTVTQLDDTRLRWVAKVAGKRAEWEAKILHQDPDKRIAWESHRRQADNAAPSRSSRSGMNGRASGWR